MPGRSSMLCGFLTGRQSLFSFHIADHGLGAARLAPSTAWTTVLAPVTTSPQVFGMIMTGKLYFKIR